jgi:hypothetical protein
VLALPPGETHLGDRRSRIAQQPCLERRIAPGACHHLGTVMRPDLVLVEVDQLVEGGRIDRPLLDQQRFERLDPKSQLRWRLGLDVMTVMVRATAKSPRSEPRAVSRPAPAS